MATPVAIIGAGNIATCLRARLEKEGFEITCQIRTKTYRTADGTEHPRGTLSLQDMFKKTGGLPDAVFIAIPTRDKGEEACKYITAGLAARTRVITCEKGSLAYHAEGLADYFHRIGYTASVGGGTQMLPYIQRRVRDGAPMEIQVVLNGTLNYIFDEVGHGGRTLGEACAEAERLGIAETGSTDALSLIQGELRDVAMKACVLFNTAFGAGRFITPDDIRPYEISELGLINLAREAADRRFVVTFTNQRRPEFRSHLEDGLQFDSDEWYIRGGFRSLSKEKELAGWLPGGVGNAMHIIEGELGIGGKYLLSGPGAGPEATVSAMMSDLS